jgi:hypothetical protein
MEHLPCGGAGQEIFYPSPRSGKRHLPNEKYSYFDSQFVQFRVQNINQYTKQRHILLSF